MIAGGNSRIRARAPCRGISATRTRTDGEIDFIRSGLNPVFRSIAEPVSEVARAADRPESGQDELKAR